MILLLRDQRIRERLLLLPAPADVVIDNECSSLVCIIFSFAAVVIGAGLPEAEWGLDGHFTYRYHLLHYHFY